MRVECKAALSLTTPVRMGHRCSGTMGSAFPTRPRCCKGIDPMTAPPTQSRYHPALIALHWGVLLLIVGVYASMELRELLPRGSTPRELLKIVHYSLGLTVFALVIARIVL